MSPQHLAQLLQSKTATIATLEHQLDWFKRQLFGKKSERFAPEPEAQQMHLGQLLGDIPAPPEQPEAGSTVPSHTRLPSPAATSPTTAAKHRFSTRPWCRCRP